MEAGRCLCVFAEGTANPRPGVLDFKLAAFATATWAGAVVVPVAIKGARSVLRVDEWFPRRGEISVAYLAKIFPRGLDFTSAVALCGAARLAIIDELGEP
ncbi:MAG: acyl-phosphate glycerol 3-phosphate acyltransferase, partial [Alphaproteobacteria bacterium]|nr:acyl-phosphate glycerol 3-phosphate acyltransferase [Alphaproteobacteria bacterium]